MRTPRRGTAALLSLVVAAGLAGTATVQVAQANNDGHGNHGNNHGHIKNVIYLLGDGMGRTHVTAARDRYYGADGHLVMERFPAVGQVSTYAVQMNSGQPDEPDFVPEYVTDSASAATTWASGVKTYNAALGVDAKGNKVKTMMELAKKAGLRTGNVSTADITDATPASQVSHVLLRGCQGPTYTALACQNTAVTGGVELPTSDLRVTPVADQIAHNNVADVILGGGLSRFDATNESELEAHGYDVLGSPTSQTVATETDLAGTNSKKVFALFNKGNMTVEKYKRENPASVQAQEPSVAEMTTKALSLLTKSNNKGFYLQVEGALIDKRSHANDAAQALEEMKAFDEAVKVAYDFARHDGHTLVIVTADHETGGFSIIEKGTFTNAEATTPPANADSSNPANNSTPSRPAGGARDPLRSSGAINGAGSGDPKNFAPATFRTADDPPGVVDGSPDASLWLIYMSGNHTGEDVPVFAYGPDSDELEGSIDNTDLFDIVGEALRLTG